MLKSCSKFGLLIAVVVDVFQLYSVKWGNNLCSCDFENDEFIVISVASRGALIAMMGSCNQAPLRRSSCSLTTGHSQAGFSAP